MRNAAVILLLLCSLQLVHRQQIVAAEPTGKPHRRVTINTISYYETASGKVGGAATKVGIWYDRASDKRVRLAFIEDEIDGFGDQWRGAAWQAALVAADLCGHDMAGTRIFLERNGRVDGPSAGAITTVGVLAALRGDRVRQDIAMTGTINPDGTIGPVGGIAQKIDGAAAAGIKTVLIPYGMRVDRDKNLKRDVDLVERGAQKGVDVKLVGDIYTAYHLMTGTKLYRPEQAPAPTLSNHVYRRLKTLVGEWQVRYREQVAKYNEVPEQYCSDFTDSLVEEAAEWEGEVESLIRQGQVSAAYNSIVDATWNVMEASETGRVIWVDEQRGRKEAILYAKRFAQVPLKVRLATETLKNHRSRTLGQVGTLVYSYSALTEAICQQGLAEAILDGKFNLPLLFETEDEDEEQIEKILETVGYMVDASLNCQLVEDNLTVANEFEGRPLPKEMPLAATADFFRRTAQANLNQFEKSIIEPAAKSKNVSFDNMKRFSRVLYPDYLVAWWGLEHAWPQLLQTFDGEMLEYARLGLAIQTYARSSSLMAVTYSLGAEYDEDGTVKNIQRKLPLKFMLDFSEDQARRNIQALRNADVDPSDIVFSYLASGALRGGEPAERLMALQLLWEANIVARTVAYLGGFADGVAQEQASQGEVVPIAN